MNRDIDGSRRAMLWLASGLGVSFTLPRPLLAGKEEEEVTPAEDLMREHGLLKRILLIYDEVGRRIARQKDFPPEAIINSAKIIRSFIEQYHEKLEEDYLFPRFRKHNLLVDRSRQLTRQTERVRLPVRHVALRSGQSYAADGILAEPEDGRTVERAACLHRKGCKYECRGHGVGFSRPKDVVPKRL